MVRSFIQENRAAYNSAWVPATTKIWWKSPDVLDVALTVSPAPEKKGGSVKTRGNDPGMNFELWRAREPVLALTSSPVCLSMSDAGCHRRNCWLMIGPENCWVSTLCGSFTANNILYSPIMTLHFLFSLSSPPPFCFPLLLSLLSRA